jgi:large subunit ribosomal protein L24
MKSKFLNAPLSAALKDMYSKKTVRVIKGDTVKVTRGDNIGDEGLVDGIDTRNLKLIVHGVSSTKVDGTEVPRPIDASKVEITKLKLDDKRRVEKLGEKE